MKQHTMIKTTIETFIKAIGIITFIAICTVHCFCRQVNIIIQRTDNISNPACRKCIIGDLYVNGEYFCKTLELPFLHTRNAISSIPPGTYRAWLKYSQRHSQWRIQLEPICVYVYNPQNPLDPTKKKMRVGIQIHAGTRAEHSRGCIMIGSAGPNPEQIYNSRNTFRKLLNRFFGDWRNPNPYADISITIQYSI